MVSWRFNYFMKIHTLFSFVIRASVIRLCLLIIFLSGNLFSFSQVPGYMGKRFTIGYSLGIVPDENHVLTHTLTLNYAVTKRKELCVGAAYFKTLFVGSFGGMSYKTLDDEKLSTIDFSLGLKIFSRKKTAGAPLGMYFKWEALYYINTINYRPYIISKVIHPYPNALVVETPHQGGSVRFLSIGGAFGIGKQRIFFNKLVLDYGVRAGLVFPINQTAGWESYGYYLYLDAGTKVLLHELITARIGLGFLAF